MAPQELPSTIILPDLRITVKDNISEIKSKAKTATANCFFLCELRLGRHTKLRVWTAFGMSVHENTTHTAMSLFFLSSDI